VFPRLFTIPAFQLLGRDLGPFTLHSYGLLLAVAFLTGLYVASRQARKAGLDPNRVADLGVYVLIAGLLGAKLLLVFVDFRHYREHPEELLSIFQSGGVFYGGLLAAFPVAAWYVRRHNLPGWATADCLAPGVVIGQAIGRLGCFAAGCCFGKPTSVAWGVTFKDAYANRYVGTPLDIALHPTQIYESLLTLLIFFALLRVAERKRFHGQVTISYVVLYAIARFVVEFFRGDASRGSVLGGVLSTSQFIALLLLAVAVAITPYLMKRQRIAPAGA
jgi:phosphatidylglycerol---prolipoprotein diacylglyceryl transferase